MTTENYPKMEYPKDVQDIIEYTKLRKKYPEQDKLLRLQFGYKENSITLDQMNKLLYILNEQEKKESS